MTEHDTIKAALSERPSEELLAIYQAKDKQEWQEAVFDIIPVILQERGVPISSPPADIPPRTNENVGATYRVAFGGMFTGNAFGLVRDGTVSVAEDSVTLVGRVKWPGYIRVLVFLLITILPYALFGFALGILPALLVVHFLCTSPGQIVIRKNTIQDLQQDGRQVQFCATGPETGKLRKAVLLAETPEQADELVGRMETGRADQALQAPSDSAAESEADDG